MRIGYSCWGFLGSGVVGTPDGGRSHRRVLLDGIRRLGHELILLQANRDLDEAGLDLTGTYQWAPAGLPELDVLMLEWRWPIPGRNTTPCASPGHTCDLHRQTELLTHYTIAKATPTLLWDKDLQLAPDDPLQRLPNVRVLEPALWPRAHATSLLFPVDDRVLDTPQPPGALTGRPRDLPLVYIGNQYDRDDDFDTFFAPAARVHNHLVAGKWPRTHRWPHVRFTGRIGFAEVAGLYQRSLATVLLLPARYKAAGQMTQRLFEAVLAGCLPLTPTSIRGAEVFTPAELHVHNGAAVIARLGALRRLAGTAQHAALLATCRRRLEPFRLSRQLTTLTRVLGELTERPIRHHRGG